MITSVDYLTLVISGALLFWAGANALEPGPRPQDQARRSQALNFLADFCLIIGTVLFTVGSVRAFMQAAGL